MRDDVVGGGVGGGVGDDAILCCLYSILFSVIGCHAACSSQYADSDITLNSNQLKIFQSNIFLDSPQIYSGNHCIGKYWNVLVVILTDCLSPSHWAESGDLIGISR